MVNQINFFDYVKDQSINLNQTDIKNINSLINNIDATSFLAKAEKDFTFTSLVFEIKQRENILNTLRQSDSYKKLSTSDQEKIIAAANEAFNQKLYSMMDKDQNTLLMIAAKYGQFLTVNFLNGGGESYVNATNKDGKTALVLALENGDKYFDTNINKDIINTLVGMGAVLNNNSLFDLIYNHQNYSYDALENYINSVLNHTNDKASYIKYFSSLEDQNGNNLFMASLKANLNDFIQYFTKPVDNINWSFNVNLANKDGDTALILAGKYGSTEAVTALLQNDNADVLVQNHYTTYKTAALQALKAGNKDIAKAIIEKEIAEAQANPNELTSLDIAVKDKLPENTIRDLLKIESELFQSEKIPYTSLMLLVKNKNHTDLASMLLKLENQYFHDMEILSNESTYKTSFMLIGDKLDSKENSEFRPIYTNLIQLEKELYDHIEMKPDIFSIAMIAIDNKMSAHESFLTDIFDNIGQGTCSYLRANHKSINSNLGTDSKPAKFLSGIIDSIGCPEEI